MAVFWNKQFHISEKTIKFANKIILTTKKQRKMDIKLNKYIAVAYKLYTVDGDKSELVEEATESKPFQFISGYGIALDSFEKAVSVLNKGDEFDFTLTKDQAYGDYEQAHVIDLDKTIFTINGHFDHEHIFVDAIVPLQNEDGNRFYGKVLSITDDKVRMDLNHPLAGKVLNFKGRVVEYRDATTDEIQGLINRMSGEGCGCGCGHHHDGEECHCHDHNHHHDGGCCHGDGHKHGGDGCGCGCHEH